MHAAGDGRSSGLDWPTGTFRSVLVLIFVRLGLT